MRSRAAQTAALLLYSGWGPIELATVRLTMPPPRSFGPLMPWSGFRSWCRWHWRQANPPTTEGAERCYPSVSPMAELGPPTPRVPAARASLTAGGGDTLATAMDRTRLSLTALLLT